MTPRHGLTADDILAGWERSTDRPIPPFVVPARPRWRSTGVLVLVGAVGALLAGALVAGPLTSPRIVEPTLQTGFASLANAAAVDFQLRLELTHPDGSEGLVVEGTAVPRDGEMQAEGWTLRPGSEWPFGGVGKGALVLAEGRLFVRHGSEPWDEIEPDPRGIDGPAEVLPRLLDVDRLSGAVATAVSAADRVSSEYVACGDRRCARHDVEIDRATMHVLVEAATGLQIDEPPPELDPLVATFIVDPDGQITSVDAGFSEDGGTIRFHLELDPLDVAPSIEPPR